MPRHFVVPKLTGTISDLLLAFGAADLLRHVVLQHAPGTQVVLIDNGPYFVIDTGIPVQAEWIETTQPFEQIAFLSSNKVPVPADLPMISVRNVDDEWENFRRYTEQRRQLGEQGMAGSELEQAIDDLKPRPDWNVATYLGDYRMQAQAIHNNLVEQWLRSSEKALHLNLRTFFALFAGLDADWDAIARTWKEEAKQIGLADMVTASQLFNPHMGKGQNRSKANKLTMGNENSFWMLEYLKAVGLWLATAPTKATTSDLRKTYVLAPRRLEIAFHQRVFDTFRARLWNSGAVKLDVTAALLYAEVLLERCIEDDLLAVFDDCPISNVVAGMCVATYPLLSANSYTTMNLSYLGLPDWMPKIETLDDAHLYRAILREHYERIRAIDDDTSDGYALLHLYRDFVSGNYLDPFFEFCVDYSSYLVGALDSSKFYIKPFTETNLRRLLVMVDPTLSPILESDGFRNIAHAIRSSTLIPLYMGRESRFEVRYGLGQELMRKAQYKDDFIQALAEFLQSYNDESMRVHERTKGQARRKLITTQDIEQVVQLVDLHGSKTVCNLLVAYGYARDPRESSTEAVSTDGSASTSGE